MKYNICEYTRYCDFLSEEWLNPILEGVDIDYINKSIKFNASHENNVDTSTLINPTFDIIDGMNVISLFKRKENKEKTDGSPLIHALKGNFGWKIDDNSIIELFKQFIKISKKIEPKYDTIISVYSKSTLNVEFLQRFNKIIKCSNKITDLFDKVDASDVLTQALKTDNISAQDSDKLINSIQSMIDDNNYFTYKKLPKDLRKYICTSCKVDARHELKYSDIINDKDILILDDTISSGKTISDNVVAIKEIFQPKTITVITLFGRI